MSEHGEMVKLLSRTLTGNDAARRRAEHDRDLPRRNELANTSVGLVSAASPRVLHSLVLSWMLERTRMRELLAQTRDALAVAVSYAEGSLDDVPEADRKAELDGCREALRLATEAVQR